MSPHSDGGSSCRQALVYRVFGPIAQEEENDMKYRVLIEPDEDGIFVAQVPALPGCISQGKSRKEALDNIKDAMAAYIESLQKHNEPIPPAISEELVEVMV